MGIVSAGKGPTVLVVGGNHGDEIDGPLAVRTAFADLDPRNVSGTVIVPPSLNHAMVAAGRQTSPIDGGTMNRSFLARADGTVGVVAYKTELGTRIRAAECLALLHDIDDLSAPAREIVSPTDGLFIGRCHGRIVQRGNFLGLIAEDLDLSTL